MKKLTQAQQKELAKKEFYKWYERKLVEWRKDPILFAREVCNFNPVGEQKDLLNSLRDNRKTAVSAGRAVGKSEIGSIAALWYIVCYPHSTVLITSPNFQQLQDVIFGAVRRRWKDSKLLTLIFDCTLTQFRHRFYDSDWKMVIKTASKGEDIRGYNSENKLYIMDESTGIDDDIINALLGSTSEANAKVLMISNPTRRSGKFYEIFTDPTTYPDWTRVKMSRITTGYQINKMINPENAESELTIWKHLIKNLGEEHPQVRVEILGEFPLQDVKNAIPVELFDYVPDTSPFRGDAIKEVVSVNLGVDIAGEGGDLIVFTLNELNYDYDKPIERQGLKPKEFFSINDAFSRADYTRSRDRLLMRAEQLITKYASLKQEGGKFKKLYITVDGTGVGSAFMDYLKESLMNSTKLIMGHEMRKWVQLTSIKFQSKAFDEDHYINKRAEMGEQFRHKLEKNQEIVLAGGEPILYFDKKEARMLRGIRREMANIEKKFNKSRIQYESKDAIRKRINASTDTADSIFLASYITKPRRMWFI